jgi:hypothetical protein
MKSAADNSGTESRRSRGDDSMRVSRLPRCAALQRLAALSDPTPGRVFVRTFSPRQRLSQAHACRSRPMSESYVLTVIQDAMSITLKYVKSVH